MDTQVENVNESGDNEATNTQFCVIEASVVTGFEECARGEAKEKFGTDVKAARGKITWKVPIDKVNEVVKLGSIDNARVVLHTVPHFKFTDQDDSLGRLQKMIPSLDWESGIQVWRKFYDFPHDIPAVPDVIPSPEELVEIIIMKNLPQSKGEKKEKNKRGGKGKKKDRRKDKMKNETKEEKLKEENKELTVDIDTKCDDTTENNSSFVKEENLSPKKNDESEINVSDVKEANILLKENDEAVETPLLNDKADVLSSENDIAKDISIEKDTVELNLDDNEKVSIATDSTSVEKDINKIPSPKTVIIRKADPNRKQPDINITVLDKNAFPLSSESQEDRDVESMDIDTSLNATSISQELLKISHLNNASCDQKIESKDLATIEKLKTEGSPVDPVHEENVPIVNSNISEDKIDSNEKDAESSQTPNSPEVTSEKVIKKERDPTKPTFRVTCNRVGEGHKFDSTSAAACLGSAINRYFGWSVDLKKFDFEILLNIDNEEVTVAIALTKVSLHNRNMTAFGPTTLRSTIAYNMLRLCRIKKGDVICDPMCGTSAIPIESAMNWVNCYHLGGDFHEKAIERTVLNVSNIQDKLLAENKSSLKIDAVQWNIQHFPLKDQCVDVFASDLPFGVRMGSRSNNRTLYPCLLSEMARTGRFGARACLLTEDKTSLIKAIQTLGAYWKRRLVLSINIGGLNGFVFLLTRTAVAMTRKDVSTIMSAKNSQESTGEKRLPKNKLEATETSSTVENETNSTVENETNSIVENETRSTVENETNSTVENSQSDNEAATDSLVVDQSQSNNNTDAAANSVIQSSPIKDLVSKDEIKSEVEVSSEIPLNQDAPLTDEVEKIQAIKLDS